MKKFFTLALLVGLTLTTGAQEKKCWDFTQGLSDETIANLNADASNWASNGTDADGNTNNWKNAVKQSTDAYWMANGVVIEELRGLKIDIGSNKDNSVHLATTKLRLTRKGTKITFPKLANGQKITIVGRSANATATNRGIAPVQSYIQFQAEESSAQTGGACIFVGGSVEGSEGTYTFVWKVVTEETDSVDVQFQLTPDAGIDFTMFMIDKGDAPAVEEAKKVAYLGTADDPVLGILDDAIVAPTVIDAVPSIAELQENYEALVIGTGATEAQLAAVKDIIAFFPVVNTNPALYALYNVTTAESEDITISDATNAIFDEKEEIAHTGAITAVNLSGYFENDQVLATAGEASAIHVHNAKRNAYYYIPLAADEGEQDLYDILSNAIVAAAKTKKDVAAVGTPAITFALGDGVSTVTITATSSKAIYYTIDGSDPTTASTKYDGSFELTTAATVKAFAIGDGYTDSEIASKEVTIATKAAAPTIAVAREAGKSTITLAADGADVYFNFTKSEKQAESQKYTEPIELTEPATITFFTGAGNGTLQSDAQQQFVGIDGITSANIRWDILTHMGAEKEEWSEVGSEDSRSNKVNYIFGKSAKSMYTEEIDHTETLKDSEGNDSIVNYYKTVEQTVVSNVSGTWKVTSYGQVMTWENPTPGKNVGAAGSNCPEFAIDHLPVNGEDGVTNYMLNFKGKTSGEPYNATIQTAQKFAGPFDIIVFFNNGSAGSWPKVNVEISTDEQNWTKLDSLATKDVRLMKRNKLSYEGTDEVYVRLAHVGGNSAGQVFDIYLMNNGEKSQAYSEEAVGISNVKNVFAGKAAIYNLNGVRQQSMKRGLNIVIENGKARKVMVK